MPRAVIDSRLARKAIPQPQAAVQIETARVEQAAKAEISAVAAGVPVDLQNTITQFETRIRAVEEELQAS